LQRLGLHDHFDVIVCRDDVSGRAKPQPDVYQLALGKLGVAAAEALAVEDSRNGVLAARAAGLRVVAVPNPVTQHQDLSPATRHLPSLAALTLPALLAEISANKPVSRPVRQPVSQEAEALID
jgi:putative hydrolase of the HAD superfamily